MKKSFQSRFSFKEEDDKEELSMDKIHLGLTRLLKNQEYNQIDGKILKGLVNGEEDEAEGIYTMIREMRRKMIKAKMNSKKNEVLKQSQASRDDYEE